jgi:transcriptional repressor NrdR
MNCPYCNHDDSRVIDSRNVNDGIRRRRQCLGCGARFTTYERLQPVGLFVIKKDGRREEFNPEKLLSGLRKACEKRPLPTGTVDRLAQDIESRLYRLGRSEVPVSIIGDMVMAGLKKLDYIAYIRFASVYREFRDITSLQREIDSLLDDTPAAAEGTEQLPLIPDDRVTVTMKENTVREDEDEQ